MPGQNESEGATDDIAHGVGDSITFVAQADGYFAISLNDKLSVLKEFPQTFDADGNPQTPDYEDSRKRPADQAAEHNAMQYMRKAVRIKQVLGSMRTPDVAIPQEWPGAGAPPDPALIAQLRYHSDQRQSKYKPRPRLTCRKIFHTQSF